MDKSLIFDLYKIGCIKFGEFTLKSGISSPIYIDLRLIISYPEILKKVAALIWQKIHHLQFNCICGVPYTALPIATAISITHMIPMVLRRKEAKDYGTKKIIEGVFGQGAQCLIVEDLITSGMSIFETIEPLKQVGLKVQDIVVLLDREQGGKQKLAAGNYQLHSVFTISELLNALFEASFLDQQKLSEVKNFIKENQHV